MKIVFTTGPMPDLHTTQGQMVARVLTAVDTQAAEMTGDLAAFRFKNDAYEGKRHGGPIGFGWKPNERKAVKDATRRVIRGEVSLTALTREWTEAGFIPLRSGVWHTYSIRRILMRPANAGLAVYKGEPITDDAGKPIIGDWKPIITVDQHIAVCAVLNDPSRKTMTSNKAQSLTTNLAKCGRCGWSMRNARVGRSGSQYRVYRCANVGGCGKSSISQKAVDKEVITAVVYDYFRHPESVHNDDAVDSQISALRSRQADNAKARTEIMSLIAGRALTGAQAKPQLTSLAEEDDLIEAEISHLIANDAHAAMVSKARDLLFANARSETLIELSRGGRRVLADLFERFNKLSLADKRRLIEDRLALTIKPHVRGMKPADRVEIRLRRNGEIFELIPMPAQSEIWSNEDAYDRWVEQNEPLYQDQF
jgi:hypothetical protein